MSLKNKNTFFIILSFFLFLTSCGKINLLTLEQERQLGLQSKAEIEKQYAGRIIGPGDPRHAYIESVKNAILNSGQVKYKNDFAWEVRIINDNTLNAFCTPGGYIYFYTGLIKYLDNGSALAGVMGHEIAHADLRHSGKQLTTQMGIDLLLSILAGTSGNDIAQLAGMFTKIGTLTYSRDNESEADASSVKYLCPTKYQSDGAHWFFQKLIDNGNTPGVPEILSTHPNPDNRVANIKSEAAKTSGCFSGKISYSDAEYIAWRNRF
jgi:predicted Zn-dependent protease